MPRTLFISDLHLCEDRPDIWQNFTDFCRSQVRGGDRLFILGDLTEVWIGDDDDAPLARRLGEYLRQTADRGVELAFMRGNRDFLVGKRFCDSARMRLLADPCTLHTAKHRLLLTHGDLLCTRDKEYTATRREFRGAQWQRRFLSQTLAERRQLVARLRAASTASKQTRDPATLDAVPATVEQLMHAWQADIMIHGHTHLPGIHSHPADGPEHTRRTRYVLSDWRPQTQFLLLEGDRCELLAYPS